MSNHCRKTDKAKTFKEFMGSWALKKAMLVLLGIMLSSLVFTACSKPKVQYSAPETTMEQDQEMGATALALPKAPPRDEFIYTRKLEAGQLLHYRGGLPFCEKLEDLKLVLDLIEQNDFKAYALLLKSGRCRIAPKRQGFFVIKQNEVAAQAREQGSLEQYWLWKADLVD